MEDPSNYSSDDETTKNDEKNDSSDDEEESVLDENMDELNEVNSESSSDDDSDDGEEVESDNNKEEEEEESENEDDKNEKDEDDMDDEDVQPDKKNKTKKREKPGKKLKTKQESDIEEDEDYENEDEDENYLQKFDEKLKHKIIQDYHPELHQHNYEEIETLCKVVRDENGIIIDPFHKTIPFLTKYEMAKTVGSRAMQISSGGKPFIELKSNVIDSYLIALEELKQKKIPFIIKRPFPNGHGCEYWKLKDLEILE
jgi:DNA-directed RNA polymerase subunit K/omega